MSETADDDAKDELRLMTSIDGEPVRLLVHIVPIEHAEDRPTEESDPGQAAPPESPD